MEDKEKKKDDLLLSIAKERNIYYNIIKNCSYKEKYEFILNYIEKTSKNISSVEINKLIEYIKDYIITNEKEYLKKLKNIILDYNDKIKNDLYKYSTSKPTIEEKLFINQVLLVTDDLIGCHIFYFISKVFENCVLLNYKSKFIFMKEDLIKYIHNLDEDFKKMKKENEIKDELDENDKEIKMKILEEYKNKYETLINKKRKYFEFIKKLIHSENSYDFFEFCDKNLFNFKDYEKNYLDLKYIFPLIYFFQSYIKEEKYDFLTYKNSIENKKLDNNNNNSIFEHYNKFKAKQEGNDYKKKYINSFENDENENINLLMQLEKDINEKCNLNYFMRKKFTYKSSFNFIPQIEIKFNEVKEITQDLIDDLILKLNKIFEGKDIKIIEMKKGSLDIAIALNYIIKEAFNEINLNISQEKFLEVLNETLEIKTGNIKNILQDNLVIAQQDKQYKPDFINQNLLDLTTDESKDKLCKTIKEHYSKQDNDNNIFEVAKNITSNDIKTFYENLFKETKTQQDDLCEIILNNDFQEYLRNFEIEFENSLKNSIFEYNTKFVTYIYRNDEIYKRAKLICNNIETKFLFHGARAWNISRILATNFFKAKTHYFGDGIYFTDLLDYAWFYANEYENEDKKFDNVGRIPKIKESFSIIVSEIYYDNSKFEQIYDTNKEDEEVPEYGIRYVCVDHNGNEISKNNLEKYNGFIGTEFIITNQEQILPLLNITLERVEFLIVWRDNNFNESNLNDYEYFEEMIEFNKQIKKYAAFNLKTKIYYFSETDEALTFIKRKKFNKIILISNGGNNGIEFIKEARKIIGSDTISLITCYVVENYMDIIKETENLLISSKYYDCIKEFLNFATTSNINSLKELQNDIEDKLKDIDYSFSFIPINEKAFNFPYFKGEGNFSDINF